MDLDHDPPTSASCVAGIIDVHQLTFEIGSCYFSPQVCLKSWSSCASWVAEITAWCALSCLWISYFFVLGTWSLSFCCCNVLTLKPALEDRESVSIKGFCEVMAWMSASCNFLWVSFRHSSDRKSCYSTHILVPGVHYPLGARSEELFFFCIL
jgi:hypothetical protein